MSADTAAPTWQRVHPAMIAIRFVRDARQWLVPIGIGAFSQRDAPVIALIVVVGALGLVLLMTVLRWTRSRFALTDGDLRIEHGVVARQRRVVPLDRIQDVTVERPPLHRLLGLARLQAETGDGANHEAALDGLRLRDALALRDRIYSQAATATRRAAGADEVDVDLYRLGLPRTVLAGVLGFSFVWIALLFSVERMVRQTFGLAFETRANADWLRSQADAFGMVETVVALFAAVIVLGLLAGIVRAVVVDWGFRVTLRGASLVRRRGLITLSEVALARRRVQALWLISAPIARTLGLARLDLQLIGHGREIVAPLARADEIDRIADQVVPLVRPGAGQLTRGPLRGLFVRLADLAVALALPLAGLAVAAPRWLPLALAAVAAVLVLRGLAWRMHRFGNDGARLFVERGWWRRRLGVLPLAHRQAVVVRRGPFDRLARTARVTVDSAGATASNPFATPPLLLEDAERLAVSLSRGAAR